MPSMNRFLTYSCFSGRDEHLKQLIISLFVGGYLNYWNIWYLRDDTGAYFNNKAISQLIYKMISVSSLLFEFLSFIVSKLG